MRRLCLFLFTAATAFAAVKTVATPAELDSAIAAAQPGDAIVLRDGAWRDAHIVLASPGITLRAQTPGKAILSGSSTLTFAAPNVTAEGLLFQNGAIAKGAVITFRADHCRVTDSAIDNYNPPADSTQYYWVFFEGSDNSVDRTLFARKNHMGPLIGNAIKDARRNTVARCHFKDIGSSHGRNGMEIFRIWGYGGNEELGADGAFFTIDSNLFDHADGESMEIISLKSNRNRVVNNTIRATLGGITNRSGNFNTIEGNVILCEGRKGAYGMRVTGQHQRVANNYVARCDYGLMLVSGEFIDRDVTGKYDPIKREGVPLGRVPRYGWVREGEFVDNTFIDNAGYDIHIGGNYKSGWPASQRFLPPEDNHIAGNTLMKPVESTPPDPAPPLEAFHFKPNRIENNTIVSSGVAPPKSLTPAAVGPSWQVIH